MIDSGGLAAVLDELLDGWVHSVDAGGPALSDWGNRTEEQVVTMMALTAHAYSTALVLRPVLPDKLTIAHMPLVRSIFEATITAVWCDEVADGAAALINEGARQRQNLRDSLSSTRSMTDLASKVGIAAGTLPTASDHQARHMSARCSEIGLDGAYSIYRMLSALSHTSIESIDGYLDDASFQPGQRLSVKINPGVIGSSMAWSHLIASCLVWCARVTDYLDRTRTRRNDLRRIARKLEIADVLPVSYDAHRRGRRR